jgi:RimJ/RimL family protein N-acetyltransferase
MILDVRADNDGAVRLYERIGFRRVGVWKRHYRVGDQYIDVLSMEWFLKA